MTAQLVLPALKPVLKLHSIILLICDHHPVKRRVEAHLGGIILMLAAIVQLVEPRVGDRKVADSWFDSRTGNG